MDQFYVRCSIYRGGTSRGLFFHEKDLPKDQKNREKIFLKGVGAEDASHINGLGAGTSHTSKVVIIEKSDIPNMDVNYTFVQLGIGDKTIDYKGTCGNLMAAVGAFAVDEGLVKVTTGDKFITVNIWSTNINKKIAVIVPIFKHQSKVKGDYKIPSIQDPGAKYVVDLVAPGGGTTGLTLPLKAMGHFTLNNDLNIPYSFIDIVNPFVYINAESVQLDGSELNTIVGNTPKVMQILEDVREKSAVESQLCCSIEDARDLYKAIPKIAYIAKPKDYQTSTGTIIRKEEYDILARMLSMGKIHKTFAVSGLLNLAAACLLKGTIPNQLCTADTARNEQVIRIGHPEGISEIRVGKDPNNEEILYVGLERTVRKIMEGNLYIPL